MQRFLRTALGTAAVVFMLLCCGALAQAAQKDEIVILHTNDMHCAFERTVDEAGKVQGLGFAGVAAYKKEMQALHDARVTLVDAGDAIQGGAVGTLSKGAYLVELMNVAGYDFAIPGNHEFDYGMENFLSLARSAAKYTYLSANFLDARGKAVFAPYAVVDYGNAKVAYVGVCTPETFTKSTPVYFQDQTGHFIYSFCEGENGRQLYRAVQDAVDAARRKGAEYVVAVAHLGREGSTLAWRSDAVLAHTAGIDVMIDGHSHEAYNLTVADKDGRPVKLVQTGTKLAAIGKIVIDPVAKRIDSELVADYGGSDPAVEKKAKEIADQFAALLDREIARSKVVLTTSDPSTGQRAVRSAETNLGDLYADAYRKVLGADVAFVNGGGLRADLAAGPVTYGALLNVSPYSNRLCLAEVTGQQILDALEWGAQLYPEENGAFLQVSGLCYAIDPAVPSSVVRDARGGFVRVDGAYRVHDVRIGGAPLRTHAVYTLASYDYLIKNGGAGFTMLQGSKLLQDSAVTDMEALLQYLQKDLGGSIGEAYENPRGQERIRALPLPAQLQRAA